MLMHQGMLYPMLNEGVWTAVSQLNDQHLPFMHETSHTYGGSLSICINRQGQQGALDSGSGEQDSLLSRPKYSVREVGESKVDCLTCVDPQI